MAVQSTSVGDGLRQALGAWFDPGSDWTHSAWVRYDAAADYYTAWMFLNNSTETIYVTSYAYPDSALSGTPFVQDIEVGLNAGYGDFYFAEYTFDPVTPWTYLSAVYTASDQTIRVYLNGVQVAGYQPDVVADLSVGGLCNCAYLMTDESSLAGVSMAYSGLWQAAHNATQIQAQMVAATPQITADLVWFTPLDGPSFVADISGNGRDWSVLGSLVAASGPPIQAVPPNTTPATAIEITSSPFSATVSAADIVTIPPGFDYPSTCQPEQLRPLWWKYTTRPSEYSIAVSVDASAPGNYSPSISVWTGSDPSSLTQVRVTVGLEPSDFCSNLDGAWFQVPVQPLQTYYFQINDRTDNYPLTAGLVFQFEQQAVNVITEGALFICDDADGYPGAVINQTTGEFDRFLPFPAGEFADWVSSGEICTQSGDGNSNQVAIMRQTESAYEQIALITLPNPGGGTTILRGIKSNKTDTFFVFYTEAVDPGPVVTMYCRSFDVDGNFLQEWTLPSDAVTFASVAVNREGTICYYALGANNSPVRRYDLLNSVPLSDLAAGVSGERTSIGGTGDGFVAANGDVFIGYRSNTSPFEVPKVRRYSSAGALVTTYLCATGLAVTGNHFADSPDGTTFWVWLLPTGSQATAWFRQLQISDGTELKLIGPKTQNTQSGGPHPLPFEHSNSCPLLVMPISLAGQSALLTQLPVEIAYDYAILRPFITGGGLNWLTPPPVCSTDE